MATQDADGSSDSRQERIRRSPLPQRSRDLPSQPTTLIGRERELTELSEQLSRPEVRLLTLTGPAGTGKTRLAVELAAERSDTFRDGSVFVDLAPIRDPALVISAIATACGLLDVGSQPLIETVKLYVRDRHLLTVLDNFEQVLAAAPLLAELLAASTKLKLVVTSRAALRLWRWEHEFPVDPLALPDVRRPHAAESLENVPSVALFVERARARRPDFALGARNAPAVAEICVRLDGLPLALELAAAGIKLLSPQALLARLRHRLDLLGEGGADFPSRHHTLREAVAWSHDLLSPREQALLRRLAVFIGGFSLEAAEAICAADGVDAAEVLPLLAQLVDQSLVVAQERGEETRYHLLETIREYASEQLHASGEAEFYHRRHADWFVRLGLRAEADLRGPNQSAWLDRLEVDHDNLRAALGWLSTRDETQVALGLRLAAALWQFWWLRGYLGEARQRLEALLARAAGVGTHAEWAKALLAAGVLAFRQGDYPAARAHLEGSLARARELADPAASASALRYLGRMAIDRGEFGEAHRLLDECLGIERALGNRFGTAWSLNYLGLLAHFEGDNAGANALLEQVLPMMRVLEDRWGTAVALTYLGRVACDLGDTSAAVAMWTESLDTCRAQGYLWCVPYLLECFAGLAVARGQAAQGVRLAGAAHALHESIGAPLPPVWQADLDRRLEPGRRALGESALAAAWGHGRALSLDEATAEAGEAVGRAERADGLGYTPRKQRTAPPRSTAAAGPLETRYAKSGDVNIAYQVLGNGPVDLVFVMGWVSHMDYYWEEPRFSRFLRRLASFARLLLFDKRGTGLSDRVAPGELPALEQRMDDVRAVMDAAGSRRAALLGVSEGAAMCALFAATYPERTAALVMIGGYARRLWAPDNPWGDARDELRRFQEHVERSWPIDDALEERAPSLAHDQRFREWWVTYLRMSASPGAAVALSRMNSEVDIRHVLPSIRVPALILHRTGDRSVPVEGARYMASRIPGAKYVELPGDDHLPFVGDQDAILAAVEEFLTGVRPAAEPDRVLATVLAMEVVHAVETVAGVGQRRWRAIDEAYRALVRDQLERHHGQPAGTAGSGFLATFNGPARGIRCALAIISESRSLGIELRAALHTGECELVDGGLGGEAFRRATSLMAQAEPGEVLVSSIVRDLVAGSGIQLEERDARSTPGEPGSRQLFRVGLGRRPAHLAGGAEPPPPAARPQTVGPLTPREREVAVLLARGLTNRQIGDQLVISAATAERHVINIFNKLGFHSRSQLAAWVVEHGLGRASS